MASSNTDNPTIVETIKHPAKTDCGIEYDIIENIYSDGSKTFINAPYIPLKVMQVDQYSPAIEPLFTPQIAFRTRYLEPKDNDDESSDVGC